MTGFSDGLPELLAVIPPRVRERLEPRSDLGSLIEIVLDYGRPVEVRFRSSTERWADLTIEESDLSYVVRSLGEFGQDNRAGIERTLHRISAIRNRHGKIIGLTCRVGRAVQGTIDMIEDVVRGGKSILLLGRPGTGKTTKLREVARVLADDMDKRVVIVDTSNEIGGDGDIPHPAVGSARRMQVPNPALQHNVMIEAVENHMPEVIVIDEIGNEAEAMASRTIAERGVQLVATAHGGTLENLMLNPSLSDLIGGIQSVTLSDDEAKRRGTQKTVLERKAPPSFDVIIELLDFDRLAIHQDVQKAVDALLRGAIPRPEIRVRSGAGQVEIVQKESTPTIVEPELVERFPSLGGGPREEEPAPKPSANGPRALRIFPYGIARTRLERAIRDQKVNAVITSDIQHADAIIAIRSTVQNKPSKLSDLPRSAPTVVVKSNTYSQISSALAEILSRRNEKTDAEAAALRELIDALDRVGQTGQSVDLAPRDDRQRMIQHREAEKKGFRTEAVGKGSARRVRVLPAKVM
jgi:stage III sporulation protein SpoIIIAA